MVEQNFIEKEQLADLFKRAEVDWNVDTEYSMFKNPDVKFVEAKVKGIFIGMCFVNKDGWISCLVVDKAYRNKGVATALLHSAKAFGGNSLECIASLVPFYEKQGFKVSVKFDRKYREDIPAEVFTMELI